MATTLQKLGVAIAALAASITGASVLPGCGRSAADPSRADGVHPLDPEAALKMLAATSYRSDVAVLERLDTGNFKIFYRDDRAQEEVANRTHSQWTMRKGNLTFRGFTIDGMIDRICSRGLRVSFPVSAMSTNPNSPLRIPGRAQLEDPFRQEWTEQFRNREYRVFSAQLSGELLRKSFVDTWGADLGITVPSLVDASGTIHLWLDAATGTIGSEVVSVRATVPFPARSGFTRLGRKPIDYQLELSLQPRDFGAAISVNPPPGGPNARTQDPPLTLTPWTEAGRGDSRSTVVSQTSSSTST